MFYFNFKSVGDCWKFCDLKLKLILFNILFIVCLFSVFLYYNIYGFNGFMILIYLLFDRYMVNEPNHSH
jgi:hypothetical protein